MSEGLLSIAYGYSKYIEMAKALSRSYRRLDPKRPIAVVTDENNIEALAPFYDIVIPLVPSYGAGVVQKLHADLYSPFDKTLFVDSDCLFYRDPEVLWEIYAQDDFIVRGWRYLTGSTEFEKTFKFDQVADVAQFLQANAISRLAHFNSGVIYFTKSEVATRVFEIARSVYENRESLGFVPFKNAPMGDEPAFAVALERCGIELAAWDDAGMETGILIERVLEMNVLRGAARFIKGGTERRPALVHYNVWAQYDSRYGRDMLRLKHESRWLGRLLVELSLLGWKASALRSRLRDRSLAKR